mmetsp:Transcript_2118/g.3029  ORF Transcript_2118/g.3029 Transcript_2118/m.3029 type:complete len:80 (-) Transcript_2118:54-293(-)
MHYYSRGPLMGNFGVSDEDKYPSVDINNAYPASLLSLKYLPVGDPFCVFEKYNNTPIESYHIYLVKKSGKISKRDFILF